MLLNNLFCFPCCTSLSCFCYYVYCLIDARFTTLSFISIFQISHISHEINTVFKATSEFIRSISMEGTQLN